MRGLIFRSLCGQPGARSIGSTTKHSSLRPTLNSECLPPSRWPQGGDLASKVFVRAKTGHKGPSRSPPAGRPDQQKNNIVRPPEPHGSPGQPAPSKPQLTSKPRETPQAVVIYHAGTGRIVFVGMMRAITIFMFVGSCFVIAPAFWHSDAPWYFAPAIVVGSAIPMVFVTFTGAPIVSQVHLAIPGFAQKSREAMMSYLKNVPRTADLSVETIKSNLYPRRSRVRLCDLVAARSPVRPMSFINTKPGPRRWWEGRGDVYFYATEKSRPAKGTHKFFPEVWEQVFAQIKQNGARRT